MRSLFLLLALLAPPSGLAEDWSPLRGLQIPAGLGAAWNSSLPVQVPGTVGALDPADETRLALLERAATGAARTWPGYDFWSVPFLMVQSGRSAILVGHPNPPPSFYRVSRGGRTLFATNRPPDLGFYFRLDYPMWGAKVAAVQYDASDPPEEMTQLAIHERFHLFQRGWARTPYAAYGTVEASDIALAVMEHRALAEALAGRSRAMWRFVAIRKVRDERFGKVVTERSEETREGTASYVEHMAMDAAHGPDRGLAELMRRLRSEPDAKAMAKTRFYATGAAIGWWLDQQGIDWKSGVESGKGPFDILSENLPCRIADARSFVARLQREREYREALATARRGLSAELDRQREAFDRFRALPGLRVTLDLRRSSDARINFGSKGWMELGEGDLFDPVTIYVGQSPQWDFRIENRMLLESSAEDRVVLEFTVAGPAAVLVDGVPWDGSHGAHAAATVALAEPGATVAVRNGTLIYDGKMLTLRFP